MDLYSRSKISAKWLLAGESSRHLDLRVGDQFRIKKFSRRMALHLVGFLRALLFDSHGTVVGVREVQALWR